MEKINSKRYFNIICLILIVITMANLIIPVCSYADNNDEDSDFGGKLFKPISKLVVRNIRWNFNGTSKNIYGK